MEFMTTTRKSNTHSGNHRKARRFSFSAPAALSVQLVGDFTHWKEQPIPLLKGADGIWRANVALKPGEHHYRFLVDGEWREDPECTLHVPNPYGSQDSVLQVT